MRIKHYDHIKSIDKKRDALHRALGSNIPEKASRPLASYDDEIASLYSEEAIEDTEETKEENFIDVDMLNDELLNPAKEKEEDKGDLETELENPRETINRIKAEKEAIQKRLEENAIHMTNERVAELENKFENILNKLKSDSLILLNSLDMGAFKKEIAYYMVEFAEKDNDFKTRVHDLFDLIDSHRSKNTKKEVKKVKESKKKEKVKSKVKDIAMISAAVLVSLAGILYYLTGGKIAHSTKKVERVVKVDNEVEENISTQTKRDHAKEETQKTNKSDDIVTVSAPKEVNFLVETKNRFSIRCTNGYRKKFYHKRRLKGYIEDGRFYFKTKQDNASLYCSTDEMSIEKIF